MNHPDLVTRYRKTSRSEPKLVTLDGVTTAKTRFFVTNTGPFLVLRADGRTDGRADAHTWIFGPLYTISPSGNQNTDAVQFGEPQSEVPTLQCSVCR